jgi:transglutaminase-like putative cysteine protease
MTLGKLAIGLASIILGAQNLGNGFNELRGVSAPPLPKPQRRMPRNGSRSATPLLSGGIGDVVAPPIGAPAQQLKTAHVRTLNERVAYIRGRVEKGKIDPGIYTLARKIVSRKCGDRWCVPEKNNLAEAKAIFDYMRSNVRYTSDVLGVDTFQNPRLTIGLKSGDCDDYTATTCALLLSIGIPCRMKVIQTKNSREPDHIYPQCGLPRSGPTKWISMDSSVDAKFGWEAPASMIAKSWIFPVM